MWTNAQLSAAIQDVERGAAIRTAARVHQIPASSLRDHLYGTTTKRKRGRQGVLSQAEETSLEQYLLQMQDLGYPLTIGQLRLKVAQMVETRENPFRNGIPGAGWLRWFRRRHPNLALRSTQGLEVNRARNLCPENVSSFYHNLQTLYGQHKYNSNHIWNCDESGAQAGRNGGGTLVFARRGSKAVHSIIPDEREWLSVLTCVNAAGEYIPHFFIFKGKRMRRNYIERCETNSTMAMQEKAWMTGRLFSSWISHFVKSLDSRGGISPTNRHLLIMDGHGSHVTLEVVYKAMQIGLDLVTLPSHTSHRLQPLDVSVFRPFKCAFRGYRDAWTLQHRGQPAQKEDLAQWVDLALKRALSPLNITKGFRTTGIWPFNSAAMEGKMGPSAQFVPGVPNYNADRGDRTFYTFSDSENEGDRNAPARRDATLQSDSDVHSDENEDSSISQDDPGLQILLGDRITSSQLQQQHYFVGDGEEGSSGMNLSPTWEDWPEQASNAARHRNRQDVDGVGGDFPQRLRGLVDVADLVDHNQQGGLREEGGDHGLQTPTGGGGSSSADTRHGQLQTSQFFELPQLPAQRRHHQTEPLVDYTKSIIMTSEEYIQAMEAKAARKEALEHEKDQRRLEAERTRGKRAEEKRKAESQKIEKRQDRAARKAFNERWSPSAIAKAGEDLHRLIKSGMPPAPGAYTGRFLWFCPEICRRNQAVVMARRRACKAGIVPDSTLRTIPPSWVHKGDSRFAVDIGEEQIAS
jgi:hypothetical protein